MQQQKGFTIIELIVVIAIIAVLAAIVLVNVTSYINKAKNVAIKANLNTILTAGATYIIDNGSYNNFCQAGPGTAVYNAEIAILNIGITGTVCYCDTTSTCANVLGDNKAWCACAKQVGNNNTYCVDSTGYKGESGNACTSRCQGGPIGSTSAICQP